MPTGLIVLKDTVLMEAYKGGRGLNALILINLRIYTTLYFDHFTTWASKSAKNFTLCVVIPLPIMATASTYAFRRKYGSQAYTLKQQVILVLAQLFLYYKGRGETPQFPC